MKFLERYTLSKMNKIKVEIYKALLRDVSSDFDGAQEFTKQKFHEICDRRKIYMEEVI